MGFGMRRIQRVGIDSDGAALGQLAVEDVFVVPDGQFVVLGAVAENRQKILDGTGGSQTLAEHLQRQMAEVVVRSDPAQGSGLHVGSILVELDAVGVFQLCQRFLNQRTQIVIDHLRFQLFQAVVGGILKQSPEEVGPRQVIDSILLGTDRTGYNLNNN